MQPNKPVILSADRETLLGGLTKSYGALMLRLRQDQVRSSGGADSVRGLVIDGHVEAGARRRCGVPGSAAARCEPFKAWCLQAALGRRHTSKKICRWHQRCIAKFAQGDTAFEFVSRSNSLAKTPMTSWRSSSCPQRTHHTAGSSASLLPQIWICRDT